MAAHEIDTVKFLDSRAEKLKILIDSISPRKKNTLEFQRVPYFKRRRTNNSDTRTTPKIHNRGKRHRRPLDKLYVWYAKRCKVIRSEKLKIPLKYNGKCEKYIYKKYKGGGIMLLNNYIGKKVYVCEQDVCINEESLNVYKHNNLLYIETLNNISSENIIDELTLIELYTKRLDIDLSCIPGIIFTESTGASLKIFIKKCDEWKITYNLITRFNATPLTLQSLERLFVENTILCDYLHNSSNILYKEMELARYSDEHEKYLRTPRGKRKNYEVVGYKCEDTYFIKSNNDVKCINYYKCVQCKGNIERGSYIYNGEEQIGVVVNSWFSFQAGYNIFIVNLYITQEGILRVKNIKNGKTYEIKKI